MFGISKSAELGQLHGTVLVGFMPNGKSTEEQGEWLLVEAKNGRIRRSEDGVDPLAFRARVDPIADAAGDKRPAYDLKLAAKSTDFDAIKADLIAGFVGGKIQISGDEAFFIRYSPEILALWLAITSDP